MRFIADDVSLVESCADDIAHVAMPMFWCALVLGNAMTVEVENSGLDVQSSQSGFFLSLL